MNFKSELKTNKIYETYSYDKFNNLSYNRTINNSHVKKLELDIKNNGQHIPVTVDRDMNVVDGQHRLLVCKNLGFPVKYHVIDSDPDESMSKLNNLQKSWTTLNWIEYWSAKGHESYTFMLDKIKSEGLGATVILEIYSVSGYGRDISRVLRDGALKVDSRSISRGDFLMRTARSCESFIGSNAMKRSFLRALKVIISNNDNFSSQRMIKGLKKNPLNIYAKTEDTVNEIISNYNYRLKLQTTKIS